MKKNKNTITLTLMISSLTLLMILQCMWLMNSYEKAFHDYSRESNSIFRETTLGLYEAMFLKNIEPVTADSASAAIRTFEFRGPIGDSIPFGAVVTTDTTMKYINLKEAKTEVHVMIKGTHDSVGRDVLKPIASQLRRIHYETQPNGKSSFVIRLIPDTVCLDTLRTHLRKSLAKANLPVNFIIQHLQVSGDKNPGMLPKLMKRRSSHEKNVRGDAIFTDTIKSDRIPVNPLHEYQASMLHARRYIIKEITPQLLFSIFLTLMTTASFIFMYRNIRAQQRLMEAKNEFISNVTHELKTPVATVSVALEALKNFSAIDNPKLKNEYLDIAGRELERLAELTDRILDASILESQGILYEPVDVDLDAVISELMTAKKMVFEKRKATVTYEREGSNFVIKGSAMHLTNVITNLVDNALKYSSEHPVVTINLRDEATMLIVSVADNGIGIEPEYQKKIFEKFFRIRRGDVHNVKGYGLGLNYVANVVKSHHGIVDVKSNPGEGSTFIIQIPRHGKIFRKRISLGKNTSVD